MCVLLYNICLSITILIRHEFFIYLDIWNITNIVMCCHSDNCTKNSKNHFLLDVLRCLTKSSLIPLHELYYLPCIICFHSYKTSCFVLFLTYIFKVTLILFQTNEISVHSVVTLNAFHIHLFFQEMKISFRCFEEQ